MDRVAVHLNETMALTRRTRNAAGDVSEFATSDDPRGARTKPLPAYWIKVLITVTVVVGVAMCFAVQEKTSASNGERSVARDHWSSTELIYRESFENGVHLSLNFARPESQKTNDFVTLGPHNVSLKITRECVNPRFWLRLVGEALVYIPLSIEGQDKKSWSGTFFIPSEGTYSTDARWFGCDGGTSYISPEQPTQITAQGVRAKSSKSLMFPDGAWITANKFRSQRRLPPYIWTALDFPPESSTLVEASDTVVSKEGTPIDKAFSGLSNYELVCWVGSKSAEDIRTAFLNLRKELYKAQRPFKFHIYPMKNFETPDELWDDGKKRAFRKCKHLLVSVDEMEKPVTQEEYKTQVTTFLHHLVKCFQDPTFPIWMLTVNEPPMNASMCTTATRSNTDHPCNTVLKDLFSTSPFPSHVQLLDNTDVSLPQFDRNQKDIFAVIAMRIYAIVGTRVAQWRDSGQRGAIDGLHRGDKIELNEELLVPYIWGQD
jgi:hypothetical protein